MISYRGVEDTKSMLAQRGGNALDGDGVDMLGSCR